MKMTKYQKQLLVAVPTGVISFLCMYLTFPLMWVGAVCIIPFIFSLMWTLGVLFVMLVESNLGEWLSEDDK